MEFNNPKQASRGSRRIKKVAFAEAPTAVCKDSTFGKGPDTNLSAVLFTDQDWLGSDSIRNTASYATQSDCDLDASASSRNQPNILKKRENSISEPIKRLPFSPSRFLNSSTSCRDVDKDKVTKDLNFSLTHTDDSGFETSACEPGGLFAKALTSTPICRKFQKPLSTPLKAADDTLSPLKPCGHLSETCISTLPELDAEHFKPTAVSRDSGNETVFKTPLIRRFLNESGPRTPTPFKCEGSTSGCNKDHSTMMPKINLTALNEDDIIYQSSSLYDSRSTGIRLHSKVKPTEQCRSQKKARKALVLDMETGPVGTQRSKGDYLQHAGGSQLAVQLPGSRREHVGFVPFDHPVHRNKIRIHNCSGLVGDKAVVQCRTFGLRRKSFCVTHQDLKKEEENKDWKRVSELNKRWVAVACGHSEDQRTMTIAAKHYLRTNNGQSNRSDLSSAVLKKRFVVSSMMR